MTNHLKPNEENYSNNPQDLLNASLILARALSLIFEEDQGIVVDVVGDAKFDDVEKVIVFKKNDQVHIYKCEEDMPEGTAVIMSEPDTESNND